MGFLSGKRALIIGVASNRSIACGIAQAMHSQGAELAFTYQTDKLKSRVDEVAAECNSQFVSLCDVSRDEDIDNLMAQLRNHWGTFDILVHSVAYAPAGQLEGDYLENVSREGSEIAHNISSYSFVALAKAAYPLLNEEGALLTLTYLGSERVVPNYNIMGPAKASLEANVRALAYSMGPKKKIRVNAISAGTVRTLAAAGIKDFRDMHQQNEQQSPLRRNASLEQIGNTAAFLCSDLASAITGEIIHVDSGYHLLGMSG